MSLVGLWHHYKYANILPEEQLLGEGGNVTRSASPTEQNVIFQNLGQRFQADAEYCEMNTPGQNKAMPSDPAPLSHSRSLPVAAGVSSVFTATFALSPGRNVWRPCAQLGKT